MTTNLVSRSVVLFAIAAFLWVLPAAGQDTDPADEAPIPPQIILNTQKVPDYPPAAFAARFSGSVMVEASVLKDGTVGEVKVLSCSRPKVGFEQATIEAVKQWRFEPGHKSGEPVEYSLKFRLNFRGSGPGAPQVSAGSFKTDLRDEMAITFRETNAPSPATK